ncbi:hypothetical protein BDZ88DRAFT_435178 [Geranomyces variabilis]|nr:hypothetical protein BDZ88DRAFT_435178 [Geranomyces variabilis]
MEIYHNYQLMIDAANRGRREAELGYRAHFEQSYALPLETVAGYLAGYLVINPEALNSHEFRRIAESFSERWGTTPEFVLIQARTYGDAYTLHLSEMRRVEDTLLETTPQPPEPSATKHCEDYNCQHDWDWPPEAPLPPPEEWGNRYEAGQKWIRRHLFAKKIPKTTGPNASVVRQDVDGATGARKSDKCRIFCHQSRKECGWGTASNDLREYKRHVSSVHHELFATTLRFSIEEGSPAQMGGRSGSGTHTPSTPTRTQSNPNPPGRGGGTSSSSGPRAPGTPTRTRSTLNATPELGRRATTPSSVTHRLDTTTSTSLYLKSEPAAADPSSSSAAKPIISTCSTERVSSGATTSSSGPRPHVSKSSSSAMMIGDFDEDLLEEKFETSPTPPRAQSVPVHASQFTTRSNTATREPSPTPRSPLSSGLPSKGKEPATVESHDKPAKVTRKYNPSLLARHCEQMQASIDRLEKIVILHSCLIAVLILMLFFG